MAASGRVANGIGHPVRRKEDFRLLTGKGSFGDDLALPGMAHAVIVRSPHAHARIIAIDKRAASASPGVLSLLTGADYLAEGLGPIPHNAGLNGPPDVAVRKRGWEPITTLDYPMPADQARFVGEPVAMVVAETIAAAKDAAERLDIAYAPLPAVARAADALKPDAPRLWENAPGNLCVDIELGDEAATATAFARAAHVVRLDTWVQRITGVPMEPRTNIAEYDAASGHYTLYTGSGRGVAKVRLDLAEVLGVPAERVRVLCKDMGGNFGTRNFFYPEYALLAWAACRVGRPVKWTCERSESFLSDYQGRDLTAEAELALDEEGNFLAVRGSNLSNLGGHAAAFVPLQKGLGLMSNVYRIPVGYFRGRCTVTNTASTTPYRSAGRPEAIFIVERLIDLAADKLRLDPVALRRRNMIPPAAQPYANPLGVTYDSGDYEAAMNTALDLAEWDGFPARRTESRRRGKWRGIGVANYVEITSGAPRERTEITVLPDRKVELVMGTMSSGQGHETSFAQLVTEWLGVPFDSIVYAMPRADTFPELKTALSEVPSPSNRLGVRSGGEGGTTPALAAVINAIVDALAELGVRHIEMPATPERVWRAIRAATAG
jgi:carbon-monoxide dehydrogenase large subunit